MKKAKERWEVIEGFNGIYKVSSEGRILSMKTGTPVIMKRQTNDYGFSIGLRVEPALPSKSSLRIKSVARLVAEAFVPNPEKKKHVDFKDGNVLNCSASNLFWCNQTERMANRWDSRQKAVHQYALDGTYLKTWKSASEVREVLGITGVSAACRGVQPAAGGYIWMFDTGTDPTQKKPVLKKAYRPHGEKHKIEQRNANGALIKIWDSIKEACDAQEFRHPENVSACLKGRRKSAYGYLWTFSEG